MPEEHFRPPQINPLQTDSEIQAWAEQFQRPRALQELPLILVPISLWNLPIGQWQTTPTIQSALQTWLQAARLDDERLRIERRFLPHTPVYIPDTLRGRQFFKLAKAIGDIPLNAPILPKNSDQGYWLKTLHYHWQARGVVIAQQLLDVTPDPLEEFGALRDRLSNKNLNYLRLSRAVDIACLHLLTRGRRYIKQWAKENQISYPFETPWDLFLQLLREDFLVIWQLGPENQEREALSKAKQRDNLAIRVRLLKQSPWLMKEAGKRKNYTIAEQEYIQYLRRAGWSGYWLLALRPHGFDRQIERNWESYAQALSKSKELIVDILDWSKGHPFDRPRSNSHRSVEGTTDFLGYIHWIWK